MVTASAPISGFVAASDFLNVFESEEMRECDERLYNM